MYVRWHKFSPREKLTNESSEKSYISRRTQQMQVYENRLCVSWQQCLISYNQNEAIIYGSNYVVFSFFIS